MIDILQSVLGLVMISIMLYVTYISSVLVSEKHERQRKGITDYYDNPIQNRQNGLNDE